MTTTERMPSGRFTLSWPEYDFLWEHLQLGPYPTVLNIDAHGRTVGERAEYRTQAWHSLARKGFGEPRDLNHGLERCLRVLARPEWELDARLHLSAEGPRTSALIGATRSRAAVGVLDAEACTVWPTAPTGLARAAVGLLPPHPAGTGVSITLPAEVLDRAAGRAGTDADALQRALVAEGLGREEARKIADVTGEVVRFGHFGAAHTPRHGARRRADHVVSVYDNPLGRYLFSRRPNNGQLWVTLTPGTTAAIVAQVDELIAGLARVVR